MLLKSYYWAATAYMHGWILGWFAFFLPAIFEVAKEEYFSPISIVIKFFDPSLDWSPTLTGYNEGSWFYAFLDPGFLFLYPYLFLIFFATGAFEMRYGFGNRVYYFTGLCLAWLLVLHTILSCSLTFTISSFESLGILALPSLLIILRQSIRHKIPYYIKYLVICILMIITLSLGYWLCLIGIALFLTWELIQDWKAITGEKSLIRALKLVPKGTSYCNLWNRYTFRWWLGWSFWPLIIYFFNHLWLSEKPLASQILVLIGILLVMLAYMKTREIYISTDAGLMLGCKTKIKN